MATAFLIEALPFSDTGSTAGHINDYDWCCPYCGSTSPDVVYKFVAQENYGVTIDLCSSLYDTKVYVVEDAWSNVIACNDDAVCGYSGYQSKLESVSLDMGHTYYIIVDGYGGLSGTYAMNVTCGPECIIECPPGGYHEQEPWCHDDYVDDYNSGCSHDPVIFEDIAPGEPGETVYVCGTGGNYLFGGLEYRDTDWFQLTLDEAREITVQCEAEFPVLMFLIYNADCADMQHEYALGGICEPISITREVGPGSVWVWIGTSVFSGVPCGSDYLLTIQGYDAPTPVESAGWGAVKALYR